MRWDNLQAGEDERTRLPGYREEAVVRHFEAPEAIATRFYEVRAKSILNRVPEASQVPFRWTINPYRGCTHACVYCLAGDTPVLLADGRHAPISELDLGDEIYGTLTAGGSRRFAVTTVLDKWISVKPAFRVLLEDGTELITSADHRFLTNRGWKHVCNTPAARRDRPHLTTRNHLVGTGAFAAQPAHSRDYRRGYLTGIVRGDGHLGRYSHLRKGRSLAAVHRFRLALTDLEALRRTREYLGHEEIVVWERVFQRAVGSHREMSCIGTSSGTLVERVAAVIECPSCPASTGAADSWPASSTPRDRSARHCASRTPTL